MATKTTIRNKKTKETYEVTAEELKEIQGNPLTAEMYLIETGSVPPEVKALNNGTTGKTELPKTDAKTETEKK